VVEKPQATAVLPRMRARNARGTVRATSLREEHPP
jgi:hypothetical protein